MAQYKQFTPTSFALVYSPVTKRTNDDYPRAVMWTNELVTLKYFASV